MTEISDTSAVALSPTMREVVLHWGEMGQMWGVNRSVGQIHALLFLVARPLTAQEICDTLGLARSNVSTGLKTLTDIGMVKRQHVLGDRKDYFVSDQGIWEIFLATVEGRKQKEFDPTVAFLAHAATAANEDAEIPPEVRKRIQEMHRFTADIDAWYEQMRSLPRGVQVQIIKLGAKIARFLPGGG
jgi:DNA-binding transcriptional regulator GbsR (MarR family)